MRTIWKFPLQISGEQTIHLPKGALVLSIVAQGDAPMLYALVDSDKKDNRAPRRVRIYGTGHPLADDESASHYVGTITTHDGALVWHVFVGEEDAA